MPTPNAARHTRMPVSAGSCQSRKFGRRPVRLEPLEERRLLAVFSGIAAETGMRPVISSPGGPRLLTEMAALGPLAVTVAGEITQDAAAPRLVLVDAAGNPLDIQLDDNTLLIGAATWCSACAQFKTQLAAAHSAGQLAGLRIVFAFGDEGGAGPGGTLRPEFLSDLPGEVAFLAPSSVAPARYPSAFNPQTGQFDRHASEAIGDWLTRQDATTPEASAANADVATDSQPAPSCGCGSKSGGKSTNAATTSPAATPSLDDASSLAAALAPGGPAPQNLSSSPGGSTFELVDNGVSIDLVWTGTAGADEVQFTQLTATTIRAALSLDNGAASSFVEDFTGVTGTVKGYALAGNDKLDASLLTTTAALLDGGAGNNRLYGGQAHDTLSGGSNGGEGQQGSHVIFGGDGDDTIYGNAQAGAEGSSGGNHLLVGGVGNDTIFGAYQTVYKSDHVTVSNGGEGGRNLIVGGAGEDTLYASQATDGAEGGKGAALVAGTTLLDEAALTAVLSEWTSARGYAERIANISGTGVGPRNNGDHFLVAGDDSQLDQLFGDTNGGLNWHLYTFTHDTTSRVKVGETETDTPDSQLPGPLDIISPVSPNYTGDFTIAWSPSAGASSYRLVLSNNADLSNPFLEEVTTATEREFTGVTEVTFYVGVWAINAAGSTPADNQPYQIEVASVDLRQTLFVTDLEFWVDYFEQIPPFPGFFGSAGAADYHCSYEAHLAGLLDEPWDNNTIYYRALLNITASDLESRAGVGNHGFVNVLGQQIAADRAELLSGDFTAPLLTQTGALLPGETLVWTGSNPDGTWSGASANDWVIIDLTPATVGRLVNGSGSDWLSYTTLSPWFHAAHLYCVALD